ncbi:hypothetical protein C8Q74DRAFT_102669 [Fomes fomentarius]|nr:hypothetical protein C8Q74DRAFT_102669 [Fomes fomentarius]
MVTTRLAVHMSTPPTVLGPTSAPLRKEQPTRCRSKRLERGTGVRGRYKRRIGLCVRRNSAPRTPATPSCFCRCATSNALRVCITSSFRRTYVRCLHLRAPTNFNHPPIPIPIPIPRLPIPGLIVQRQIQWRTTCTLQLGQSTCFSCCPLPPFADVLSTEAATTLTRHTCTSRHQSPRPAGPSCESSPAGVRGSNRRTTTHSLTARRRPILILAPNGQSRRGSSAATRRAPRWTRTRCSRRRSATGSRSSCRRGRQRPRKARRSPPKTRRRGRALRLPPRPQQQQQRKSMSRTKIGRHNSRRSQVLAAAAGLRRRSRSARCLSGPSSYAREARTSLCRMSPRFVRREELSIPIRNLSRCSFFSDLDFTLDSSSFVLVWFLLAVL